MAPANTHLASLPYPVPSIVLIQSRIDILPRLFQLELWRDTILQGPQNVDVPVIRAMIDLGSIVCQREFLKEGRSLKKMGLEGMGKQQMIRYLKGIKGN